MVVLVLIIGMILISFAPAQAQASEFSVNPTCYNEATLTDPVFVAWLSDNNENPFIYSFYGDGADPSAPVSGNVYDITSSPWTSPIEAEILSFDFMRFVFVDYTAAEYAEHGDAVYTLWAATSGGSQEAYEDFMEYLDMNGLQPSMVESLYDEECDTPEPPATTTPVTLSTDPIQNVLLAIFIMLYTATYVRRAFYS